MRARLHLSTTRRWLAAAASASAALAAVGLAAPAAGAEPVDAPSQCPPPVPVDGLVAGAPVTGRTVTSGTVPEPFGGSVLGVLEDGIAPDVDMVLVDLASETIDRVGIWSGMSGSPVYAADGGLIGAVAYSLGTGPSTVAGVTPAADMYRLLSPASSTVVTPRVEVPLDASLRRSVARVGAGTDGSTMSRLRVPVGMSGLGSARLRSLAPALNSQGVHLADTAAGAPTQEEIPVTAGGNMAASMSHGTITAAAIGTATAVCAGEVLGFGHPMNYTGRATMSLHGATVTHVQDDPTLSGFKVANLGAPVGTVDRDRLAGLRGSAGPRPTSHDVAVTATLGGDTREALTHVTVGSLVPEMAFTTTIAAQDRLLDRVGPGQAETTWTVRGTRRDGSPFVYTRADRYADPHDVSAATAAGLAEDLMTIQDNPGEVVTVTSVTTSSALEDDYATYRVAGVQYLRRGAWVTLPPRRAAAVRQGSTVRLRVRLTSREAEPRTVATSVSVPRRSAGRTGVLVVSGGGLDMYSSEDFFADEELFFDEDDTPAPSPATFPALLRELQQAPANDEVVSLLQLFGPGAAGRPRTSETDADRVVAGSRLFRVRSTR